jgi:hypothetical protein
VLYNGAIQILGLLDDFIIVPGLIALAVWLIPNQVWTDALERAEHEPQLLARNWKAATIIFVFWLGMLLLSTWSISKRIGNYGHWYPDKYWILMIIESSFFPILFLAYYLDYKRKEARRTNHPPPVVTPFVPLNEDFFSTVPVEASSSIAV